MVGCCCWARAWLRASANRSLVERRGAEGQKNGGKQEWRWVLARRGTKFGRGRSGACAGLSYRAASHAARSWLCAPFVESNLRHNKARLPGNRQLMAGNHVAVQAAGRHILGKSGVGRLTWPLNLVPSICQSPGPFLQPHMTRLGWPSWLVQAVGFHLSIPVCFPSLTMPSLIHKSSRPPSPPLAASSP